MAEANGCEWCVYYQYDEDEESYVCEVDLDEDELASLLEGRRQTCPFFRLDDEYAVVRKQM